ncbi:hypothetical protein HMPREF1544_12359 [Mucor circinelloides 1006PhL]|uniref:Uncharacterized protein n=1 Tax=Mucor circinelloides f. circinelloides (strain 1006PhL) TaxID=1220926 RepID=S2JMG3_MUCC1|nr:hypothetical protein HMPREF1544_12359 [Mucor circinelloides 1006PhL]
MYKSFTWASNRGYGKKLSQLLTGGTIIRFVGNYFALVYSTRMLSIIYIT